VQLGGETRWAWHAMPKVMGGTCPKWLSEWPVKGEKGEPREYEKWRGYMRGKRLNISCRQVFYKLPAKNHCTTYCISLPAFARSILATAPVSARLPISHHFGIKSFQKTRRK